MWEEESHRTASEQKEKLKAYSAIEIYYLSSVSDVASGSCTQFSWKSGSYNSESRKQGEWIETN